jgi:MFS family permease
MPVLFPEISRDLGLSMVQLGTVWGIDPFAGIFVALIAGLIVDRFGIKVCLLTLCLVAGIFGALRGLSTNFITMAGSMFLFGIFGAMLPTVTQKTIAIWFPGKRFALAISILSIGWTICAVVGTMMSATVFSPALHGWRNVLLIYGIPPAIFSLVGLVTIREPKESKVLINQPDTSFRHLFLHVIRIKDVWAIGLIVLGIMGSSMGLIGYLAVYLRGIGWTNAAASGAVTIFSAAGGISSVPLALLSNRIGS